MKVRHVMLAFVVALALTGTLSGLAAAQTVSDSTLDLADASAFDERWVPWLGCWQLWEEQFEQAEQLEDASGIIGRTSVCVTPAEAGISLKATAGNRRLIERQLVADGTRRDVNDDGCLGWERSDWSEDGHRLFTFGELTCGDSPTRKVTGVSVMASTSSWVDIQFVQFGEREQLEVRRYTPMPVLEAEDLLEPGVLLREPAEIRRARRESTEALVLADVMEANAKTTPRVVEALLVETEPDLDVDAASLIALDDAGIDHDVIDLVVALSYPEHFVVERRDRGGSWSSGASSAFGGYRTAYDPIWYGDLYPYYVTPLGARSWNRGYNPYLYGAAASPFVILPGGIAEQTSLGLADPRRGYTRVRERESDLAGQVQRRGGSTTTSRRTGASVGGSRGGTATSGGYTSGGGSTTGGSSSGRRAVPRPR